jgi:hypothetical protein
MHPILPIYAVASIAAVFGLALRDRWDRTIVWFAAWCAMTTVLIAAVFREIGGDTGRYISAFTRMEGRPFPNFWSEFDNNPLFIILNWTLSRFGTDPLWLIVPTTLFCIVMLQYSLRGILNRTDTAIAIFLYSAYPFFIFYVSSGIKQAIALALLFQMYVSLQKKQNLMAFIYLALAPAFHSGAFLVVAPVILHLLLYRPGMHRRNILIVSILGLLICTLLSATGVNQALLAPIQSVVTLPDNYSIYFEDAAQFNYNAGFRVDFTLFSFLPFAAALWLKSQGHELSLEKSYWWLNLYTMLACIYQLFSFAPFADRFAAFSWYLIPAILVVMLADADKRKPRQVVILSFALLNILILQFYTGLNLRVAF